MTWETAKDMGNRTLFLGPTSFSTSTIEENENLATNVNYCDYHEKLTFNDIEKDGILQFCEIYGLKRLVWIEPPYLNQELVLDMTNKIRYVLLSVMGYFYYIYTYGLLVLFKSKLILFIFYIIGQKQERRREENRMILQVHRSEGDKKKKRTTRKRRHHVKMMQLFI